MLVVLLVRSLYFNPRSPCGERLLGPAKAFDVSQFQSTLPVWGATLLARRAPALLDISIHAPRVGSDLVIHRNHRMRAPFQSTLPVWGATILSNKSPAAELISIHAPRVGSDPMEIDVPFLGRIFQSTLPVWGATKWQHRPAEPGKFQSTLPVWGATMGRKHSRHHQHQFQSTLPVWGATVLRLCMPVCFEISIHAPRVGSDQAMRNSYLGIVYFNPRSPCGERPP